MKRLPTLLLGTCLITGPVWAQSAIGTGARVEFEATTGPVTVVSVQPALPNADDYAATVVQLDRNGDGVVVRSEVPPDHALASEFGLVDRNRDGRITDGELSNWK